MRNGRHFVERLADAAQRVLAEANRTRLAGDEFAALVLEEQAAELAYYITIERFAARRQAELSSR